MVFFCFSISTSGASMSIKVANIAFTLVLIKIAEALTRSSDTVHALEGIGLGETLHPGPGWDSVTISKQQEFAAACDAAGTRL
jgi:hypothetical protein